jgi:F-type H+-transporting ATPase subunit delta
VSSEPSAVSGLADRYANALYGLAVETKSVDAVAADLKDLKAMMSASADLRRLLSSPVVTRAQQERTIIALAKKAAFQDLTRRFLGLVARSRRLESLPGMIQGFLDRLAKSRGEITARVTSAQALTDSQASLLKSQLSKSLGGTVSLDVSIDPSLLGGLSVLVGSRMVDYSLKTKLQNLKLAMKGVG